MSARCKFEDVFLAMLSPVSKQLGIFVCQFFKAGMRGYENIHVAVVGPVGEDVRKPVWRL